ncbi:class F sortase [Streptodolium elevatio]|uniref:Class F sortase n=1 Tax=Streptodolium elevatio TaxID=3157996 RepID=A0ABV3DTN2_9ACTN
MATVLGAVLTGIVVANEGLGTGGGPPQPAAAAGPGLTSAPPKPTPPPQPDPVVPGPAAKASAAAALQAAPVPAAAPVPGAPGAPGAPDAAASASPSAHPPMPASPPMLVEIRSIGVQAKLTRVGLTDKGWVDAPTDKDRNLAAWYDGSSTPGAEGTSVIVGHVDVPSGPAVFYDLGTLRKGSVIRVPREDGTTAVFTVYGVQVFGKKDFPVDRVYGGTGVPELRVITCGGNYDKKNGYSGNVVVFARLTAQE